MRKASNTSRRAVPYYPPGGSLFLDIMTRLGEAANYDNIDAEIKDLEGIRVRVATPQALYDMKNTIRPLDRSDARAIAERFELKTGD